MNVIEALQNALESLEALGYKDGGDIHDDLSIAILELRAKHPKAARALITGRNWTREATS